MTSVRPRSEPEVETQPEWLLVDSKQLSAGNPPPPAAPAVASPTRRSALTLAGRALTVLGVAAALFVGYEFTVTGLVHDRAQPTLLAAFRQGISSTTLDASGAPVAEGSAVALLVAPQIGLNQVVVEGTGPKDLQSGPGHMRDSPVPGEFGNAVIAGHRTTYGGPFHDLDRLAPGDRISVTTGQGSFHYVVDRVGPVPANKPDPLYSTADSRMTLVTSDPAYLPSERLVVVATLQGPPVAVPSRPAARVSADDLGLAGDPLGLAFAVLWAAVLAASLWVTWLLRARWPRSVRYTLAAPIAVLATVLLFASVDLVLPGTL